MTGGKFAHGALTAAFGYAFNSSQHTKAQKAEAFLQAETANAGQPYCTALCESTENAAHAAAGDRYLGASLLTKRETTWRVYQVGDGTWTFSYPGLGQAGRLTRIAVPSPPVGYGPGSIGHTHWDANYRFSPEDWNMIMGRGPGNGGPTKAYVATGDGRLQYATPQFARPLGVKRSAKLYPPLAPFDGVQVRGVRVRTTFP